MSSIKNYILTLLVLLLLSLAYYSYTLKGKYEREKRDFELFKKHSSSLILLKKRWSTNKNYRKIISRLKAISKPAKERIDKNIYSFDFENLTQKTLERITLILFNSGFKIKNLDIKKIGDKISLHIEVQL